jgi:carbamoyl-phosphate synthase large subunit
MIKPLSGRALSIRAANVGQRAYTLPLRSGLSTKRYFSATTAQCSSASAGAQTAPNPQAYLDRVVKTSPGVNVKKVLVIGSGGLAIGQAGEFDYSGTCRW